MLRSKLVGLFVCFCLVIFAFIFGRFTNKPTTYISEKNNELVEQKYPECFSGLCPEYFSMDVDGDGYSESAIVIPTAMTQGAGKVWIVDNGKVVFDSGEKMRIGINQNKKQIDEGSGFTLWYGTEVNSTKGVKVGYIYKNGQFKPEE